MSPSEHREVPDRQFAAMVIVPTPGGFREYPDVWISVDEEDGQLYIWDSETSRRPRSIVPIAVAQITW